mmetsp:Transcript_13415/g.37675  ORF Transcript_13415/g.37675 Transcript_13415/m.37675 type:complete len:213 (-) Transcript_13415:381-1019(-)
MAGLPALPSGPPGSLALHRSRSPISVKLFHIPAKRRKKNSSLEKYLFCLVYVLAWTSSGSPGSSHGGEAVRFHDLLDLLEDLLRCGLRRDLCDLAQLFVVVDHGHGRVQERVEPLLYGLLVVVGPPARFRPLQQALLEDLHGAAEEQDEFAGKDFALELLRLVEGAGEAVDQELPLASLARVGDGLLEEGDRDRARDEFALLHGRLEVLPHL